MQAKQNLCLLDRRQCKACCSDLLFEQTECFHIRFVCHSLQSVMTMLLASQLCFAVFLASLLSTQAEGNSFPSFISRHNNNSLAYESGFINITCSWNCTIIDSDFPKYWKTISINDRLIKVVVEYEKKVTEQCARQAPRNLNGNGTEYFNVWLPVLPETKKPSSFHHAMQGLFKFIFSSHPETHVNIKGVCRLLPLKTVSTEVTSIRNDDFLSRFVRSHLADHGLELQSSNCNAEMNDSQPCFDESEEDMNSLGGLFSKGNRWSDIVLYSLVFVFIIAFVHYSPAFVCLFSPTVVTENGFSQIVLEGASPFSVRSVVGNCFPSERDTPSQKAKILFLRIVLPLPFLLLGIFLDHVRNHGDKNSVVPFLYSPVMLILFGCYVVTSIDALFKPTDKSKLCSVCKTIRPDFICNDILPRRLLNHLCLQPLILATSWRSFVTHVVGYCKPRVLFKVPFVVLISSGKMLFAIAAGIFKTSPIVILCNAASPIGSNYRFRLCRYLGLLFITIPAISGAVLILVFDAYCILMALDMAFALLSSQDSLPYVSLIVLVCYYLWSSYSSFANKYHDLSLILFKCYKEHRRDRISNSEDVVTADPEAESTENTESTANPNNKDNVITIPKDLFDMACEKLMPVRESVCILLLKVILIVCFVFLVFLMIMKSKTGATPQMKAVLTFFTGSFPKIAEIYIDGARKRQLKTMIIQERAPVIVQRYLTGDASYDQEQDSAEVHTEEVIIVDENEDSRLI